MMTNGMIENIKRDCIMAKILSILVIAAGSSLVCCVYGEDITNISQCINTNLTSDVLNWFPTNATSNGNIVRYTDTAGNIVAEYTYNAFGRLISSSGPMAEIFRIRFSSKYYDPESGLYYYGYRFYSPSLMRWLNRDPIEKDGGLNLYGFCGNDAMSKYDFLGMETSIVDWELIGEISEAHSWNCIEWKSMSKDWKTRRKSSRGEVGEGVDDGGTQKNYVSGYG